MFHFLVYCVKLLTSLLLAYSCLCLLPLGAFIRVAYLHHGLLQLSLYCALLYSTKATCVAAAHCAAHLLSTDVYAKCHILYLSCLNCSLLFYVLLYYGGGPPSPSQPHVISQIFFVEFLIMHTRWSHIYLKAATFLPCACFFLNFTPLFLKKKK